MEPLFVLVANEPRAYRDALAGTLAVLRPDLRVESLAPNALDRALARPRPPVVVCSRLTPRVEALACAWIVLYPGQESVAIVRGPDGGHVVPDPDLDDLLDAIRQAASACGGDADPSPRQAPAVVVTKASEPEPDGRSRGAVPSPPAAGTAVRRRGRRCVPTGNRR